MSKSVRKLEREAALLDEDSLELARRAQLLRREAEKLRSAKTKKKA